MKQIIDKFVNGMTMYRLTLYALSIMAAVAIGFSVVGILQFNTISMILSISVLLAVSIGINQLFGYMFAVKTNNQSAYITALILFLIFPASDTLAMAVSLALVATIAMASKYLVVWRGRHLFNPAAFAAFISGIVGLQTASWWVATGSLLPFTFILGGLVLYKTKRLQMGLTYVTVSVLVIATITTLKGNSFVALLPVLLTSWPLLFFASFMLSEPLGSPPRKSQRSIFATGVAVLANAQLQLVGVSIGPQAALLVGNIYTFLSGQRGGIRLRFTSRRQLSRDQVEYIFEPLRPLRYQAGQYIEIQLPHDKSDNRGIRRMFTIASSPTETTMKLGVRHYTPSSTYKKALERLVPGSVLSATAIYGDFILPNDKSEKLLFIAGGIGITPFRSQLAWLASNNDRRDGVLLYSTRTEDDVVYSDILHDERHGVQVHTVRSLEQQDIAQYCKDIAQRTVYISGPPGMVDSVAKSAAALGAKRIITDHFAGY
jgi:ferredoxin-NADP reductase